MKRLLLLLFAISTTLSLLADSWTDYSTGITWQYTQSQGKVMLGRGDSYDGYTAVPASTEGNLIVPEYIAGYPVVGLNVYAFNGCSKLISITLPNSVTQIRDDAFRNCSRLTSVNIPNGVTTISAYIFSGCEALRSIELPASVTTLGGGAFSKTGLEYLSIPEGVKEIPSYCFSDSTALKSITFPSSLTKIAGSAFDGCSSLSYLKIPEGVTEITGDFRVDRALTIILPKSLITWSGITHLSWDDTKAATVYAYCPPSETSTRFDACSNLFYTRENKEAWEKAIVKMSESSRPLTWGLMSDHLKTMVRVVVVPAMSGSWSFENDEVAEGETVTLKATANEGYLFMGWSSVEEGLSSTDSSFSFAVPRQPITLVAMFLPKALIEGLIDEKIDGRIDGESLLTKEQAEAKTEATIEEKKEAGELFDQAGVDAKVEATITEKVDNKELVTRESIQEMALGTPIIEVENAQAKVGISLKRASTLDGEWEEVTLDVGAAEVDNGTVKVSVPAEDNVAFYKFVVPDGLQTPAQEETP